MSQYLSAISLPAVNASLNAAAAVLLTIGYLLIRSGKKDAHRIAMTGALFLSCLFLIGYVTNRILVKGMHTEFGGTGIWPQIYYPMLISHIILAMVIVPLVLRTLYLAVKGNFEKHRRWARVTFPLWYYVSLTGVLVYFFLYQWFPTPAG